MLLRSLANRALSKALSVKSITNWLGCEIPFLTPSAPAVAAVAPKAASSAERRPAPLLLKRYYSTKPTGEAEEAQKNSFRMKATNSGSATRSGNRAIAMYSVAALVAVGGLSYAAVPLYKMFCAATGYAGTTKVATSKTKSKIVYDHPIRIRFTSQVSDTLPWSFTPAQREITVCPGQKTLAFYVASNHHPTDALVGVATYNVVPDVAGAYFNKIQCFCFDEQRLNAGETVDMPIDFFIDPAIEDDKVLKGINEITLSYTFFLADDQSAEWWEEEREKHAKPTST